jgi:hypothetical protein
MHLFIYGNEHCSIYPFAHFGNTAIVQMFISINFIGMTDYKTKLGGLADKLKQVSVNTPIQEVKPVQVESIAVIEECRFNNWIPRSLKRKLKRFSVENEMTLKEINIQALEQFISTFEKKDLVEDR